MHAAPLGLGHQHLADKRLEVDKPLAFVALPQNLPVGNTQASNQVSRSASRVARRLALWVSADGRSWCLFGLTRLDRGFLIDTHQPLSTLQQAAGLSVQLQHRTSAREERLWVVNMLPHPVAPRADLLCSQPAPDCASRHTLQSRLRAELAYQLGAAPARKRDAVRAGQATGGRRGLRPYQRGKNASARQSEVHRRANEFGSSVGATSEPCDHWCRPARQSADWSRWAARQWSRQSWPARRAFVRLYGHESGARDLRFGCQ